MSLLCSEPSSGRTAESLVGWGSPLAQALGRPLQGYVRLLGWQGLDKVKSTFWVAPLFLSRVLCSFPNQLDRRRQRDRGYEGEPACDSLMFTPLAAPTTPQGR